MALTADDLAFLQQYKPDLQTDPGLSAMSRAGQQLADLPSNAFNSLASSLGSIGDLHGIPEVPKPYNIPAPQSFGDKATDFVLGRAAPELAASLVPFGVASKVAKVAGAGEVLANVAGNVATGGFMGAKNDTGLQDATAQGSLAALLPYGRLARLPMSMAIGGVDAALSYAQNQDPTEAGVRFLADTAFGQLPGKLSGEPEAIVNDIHVRANPTPEPPPLGQVKLTPDLNTSSGMVDRTLFDPNPQWEDAGIGKPKTSPYYEAHAAMLGDQEPRLPLTNPEEPLALPPRTTGDLSSVIDNQIHQSPETVYGKQLDQVPDLTSNLQYGKSAEQSAMDMMAAEHERAYQNGSLQDLNAAYNNGEGLLQPHLQDTVLHPELPDPVAKAETQKIPEQTVTPQPTPEVKAPEGREYTHLVPREVTGQKLDEITTLKSELENHPLQYKVTQDARGKFSAESQSMPVEGAYQPKQIDRMNQLTTDLQYSKLASPLGLSYDGVQEYAGMPKYHQFTDQTPTSTSHGASFYLEDPVTPESLKAKLVSKQKEFAPKNPSFTDETKSNLGKLGFGKPEAGFLSTHAVMTLAGGAIGGTTAYNKSHGDPVATVEGALLGAGIGFFGYTIAEGLARGNPNVKSIKDLRGLQASKVQIEKTIGKLMSTPLVDLVGETVNGRSGVLSKFVRMAEVWNNLNLPDIVRDVITRSKGAASVLADQAGKAIRDLGFDYEIDQQFKDATNRYIEGKFRPASDIEAHIRSEGGVTIDEFRKIPVKDRPSTSRLETGTRPDLTGLNPTEREAAMASSDYKVFRISAEGKANILEADKKAYLDFMETHGHLQYSKAAVTARESVMGMQDLVTEALPEGSVIRRIVSDSIGQYATRQYKLFNDKSFYPDAALIEKYIGERGYSQKQRLIEKAVNGYDAYTAVDYNGKLTKAQGSTSQTAIDAVKRLQGFVKLEHGGVDYYVKPSVSSAYEHEFSDAVLRRELGSYLNEARANKGMLKLGSSNVKVDTTLLKEREQLSPTFREMIGEYTDPMQRLAITTNRLLGSAQTGRFISMLENAENKGLPMIFKGNQEWSAKLSELAGMTKASSDPKEIATLQSQINELKSYSRLQANLRYGDLKDKIVSRFIQDQFNDTSGVWGVWDTPVGRTLAQANYITKVTHTIFNPATAMRNLVTMPIFAAIAKAGPSELYQAYDVLKAKSGPMWDEMMHEGILGVDFVNAEMRQTVEKIFTGHYDSDVMKAFGKVKGGLEEFYRIPDMMVRAGAYIGAKKRFAAELGKASSDPAVIAKAVHWVDRRTMNYGNMSNATKAFRQVPFANMYISYASEIVRLTKNLAVDASKGDLHAITALAGMYVVPDVLQRTAEAQLSTKDRKDWDRMLSLQQDYTKDRYKLPTSRNKDGSFNYIDITPLLIANDFNQTGRAIAQGDIKVALAVNPLWGLDNTPAFKIMAAQIAGKDLNTQRDFRGISDRISAIAGEIVPPILPPGYEAKKIASIGETNLRTGRTETWGGTALRDLLGVNYTSVNPGLVEKQAVNELQAKLALEKRYYMDVAATNAAPEKKARALQQYKEAVQYHLRDYFDKTGTTPPETK